MPTIKDKLVESSIFLEEYSPPEIRSKEELDNSFLDDILELQGIIDDQTNYYNKGIELLQKFTWVEDKKDFDDNKLIIEISELKEATDKVIRLGIKDYILLNNRCKKFASECIKKYKDALDDFRETSSDVFETILCSRLDTELLDLENQIKLL